MEDSVFALVLLPIALAVIMTSLGMSLTVADFRRVVVYPKGVSIGLANLLVISPLLAFAIAELYSLDPALAVGLVLLGASPGGTMANLLTHLARGDTALSITMTAISSLAAVITVPLFLELSTAHFGADEARRRDRDGRDRGAGAADHGGPARARDVPASPRGRSASRRSRRAVRRIALALFVGVVIGVIVAEHERVFDNLDDVAAAAITLNVVAMAISFTIARVARSRRSPVDRDRDRARRPQLDAGDRGRRDDRDRADDPRRRLRELHVHHRRALRPGDVQAKRSPSTA